MESNYMSLRSDAQVIIDKAICSVLPDAAVSKALENIDLQSKNVYLVAIGKAGWQMADVTCSILGNRIRGGIVITKYHHSKGPIGNLRIYEAGHPISDDNTYAAAEQVIELVNGLGENDTVLFLVSGGGSALFEKPLLPVDEYESICRQLILSGADIVEINTIRKRLSAVKGGHFAKLCAPANVVSIILSDVLGGNIDSIASGPAVPDISTAAGAKQIISRYNIQLSPQAEALIGTETPKSLDNVHSVVIGSVSQLCRAAEAACKELGYETHILTDVLDCSAREAGAFLGSIAKTHSGKGCKLAYIAGGETTVQVKGNGLGGRNQELALSAADRIRGLQNTAVFSIGSDGTDGPTDAAGGFVDGDTAIKLEQQGILIDSVLKDNDSYNALRKVNGLIFTGPTGTNVNDVSVVLIQG